MKRLRLKFFMVENLDDAMTETQIKTRSRNSNLKLNEFQEACTKAFQRSESKKKGVSVSSKWNYWRTWNGEIKPAQRVENKWTKQRPRALTQTCNSGGRRREQQGDQKVRNRDQRRGRGTEKPSVERRRETTTKNREYIWEETRVENPRILPGPKPPQSLEPSRETA